MAFRNPILGGGGALIRDHIQSPDYVTGVSGWSINADGSAEFTNLKVRGFIANAFVVVESLSSPARTVVTFANGVQAVFTVGARTVAISGLASRTFTEAKFGPAVDPFDRTLSADWGQSPAAGVWGAFGGAAADVSVTGGKGRIAVPTTNVSRYVRLNDSVAAATVACTVTTDTTPAGQSNSAAVILGWQGVSNHYRCRLTFTTTGAVQAAITKFVDGVETTLAANVAVGAGYVGGQVWNIEATTDGAGALSMAAWKVGDPKAAPQRTAVDTTFLTGRVGLRAFASTGATNNPTFLIDDYTVTGVWPDPPSITHDTWVRMLPAPYIGFVDSALSSWLLNAISDTTPDVLATGLAYVTGGATDAAYGPVYVPGRAWDVGHADDGTKQEGSDWNDFLGVTGDYPDLTVPVSDPAEAQQLGSLDCSGFLRMVFGHTLGMPMCLDDPADFDGLNIPRRAVDISGSGPGSIVAQATGIPPALTVLQAGDVVGFDADTTNPGEEEGQIDHAGVYLGVDSHGEHRFLSSRKTANGPTFGDLGGPSVLDRAGALYTRSLRVIRRF